MQKPLRGLLVGGSVLMVAAGVVFLTHPVRPSIAAPGPTHVHHPARRTTPRSVSPRSPAPVVPPLHAVAPPAVGHASGSALSAYEKVAHQGPPSVAIETAPDPANAQETWAIVPIGNDKFSHNAVDPTLWCGVQMHPGGPWTWIPSTLPGALSRALPQPFYDALQWAFDLHEGDSLAANLGGTISWSSLQGAVSEPMGWSLQFVSAQDSGMEYPLMTIYVWQKSNRSAFVGYYGLQTVWTPSNVPTGTGALAQFASSARSLAATVAP